MEKAYVVGIAGGSASGKSTFAQRLRDALSDSDVLLLPMDAYFRSEADRPRADGRGEAIGTTTIRNPSICRVCGEIWMKRRQAAAAR